MEVDENKMPEEYEGEYVELYSKRAILWFSILAAPLFGGVLLLMNLKAVGYKRAVNAVLIFTILFFFGSKLLAAYFIKFYKIDLQAYQDKIMSYKPGMDMYDQKIVIFDLLVIALHIVGGLILTQYFFKKYFPESDYYPKGIIGAVFITILAVLVLSLLGLSVI